MAKASPIIRSFNAGETSALVEGRTDLDRYPASCRKMLGYVAAPQGPAIARSGTQFMQPIYDEAQQSLLVPFVFSEDDFFMLEFANRKVRFFTEFGILVRAPVTANVSNATPFKFDSAALGSSVGKQVVLDGFPDNYNLNGMIATITAKVGNTYTVDLTFPALALVNNITVAEVYSIDSPYGVDDLSSIFADVQSLDVIYLFHPTVKTYKIKRNDTYDWTFEAVDWIDGPYLPVNEEKTMLTVSATGKATPNMTTNTLPSGTATGSSVVAGSDYYLAFDDPTSDSGWQSNVDQSGTIEYDPAASFICDGYSIHSAIINNASADYTNKDYAPSNFTFEGWDGAAWVVLDKQNDYVLYDNNKSVFFEIPNTTSYSKYRLNIRSCVRNGPIKPVVRSLIMRSTVSTSLTVTASAVTGINNNAGFKATDIGRLIRIKGSDNYWRSLKITAWTSTTVVTATLLGEPFPDLQPTDKWRLGAWSDTTGYPNTGLLHDDRLYAGGSTANPDFFAFSQTGLYENMAPTTPAGEVLDDNGYAARLNARRLSRIKWMAAGKDGQVLMGTGSEEYIVAASSETSSTGKTITPINVKARRSSTRGSSSMPPIPIDLQVLFGQRGGRTIREFAYSYETDAYKSPSMSQLASHLGVRPFTKMVYAAEPYSIIWLLREDGKLMGLTYNRDENVVGWHRHEFPDLDVDGIIESIAVLPSSDQLQDTLWLVIQREVNGQIRRYIEKLTKFWDFDMTVEVAHFVDCGLRYIGNPTTTIYGAQHLEGRIIYGLADGIPFGPKTVTNGSFTLENAAENVVFGIGFDSEGETARLENGAADGTAQGKEKRTHKIVVNVWMSYGGEVGTFNEDTQEIDWTDLAEIWPQFDISEAETIELFSGMVGPFTPAPGYEKDGSIHFRRKKSNPLPFNIVAFMPQLDTQDAG